jgi:hypothetical protein
MRIIPVEQQSVLESYGSREGFHETAMYEVRIAIDSSQADFVASPRVHVLLLRLSGRYEVLLLHIGASLPLIRQLIPNSKEELPWRVAYTHFYTLGLGAWDK